MKVSRAYRDPDTGPLAVGSIVQTARHDGLGRRIVKAVRNSADLNCTYHYYYDGQSVVEERDGSDLVIKQHVWGNLAGGYIDELLQTSINEDPLTDDICETDYYAATGPNYNVIGLFDATGAIAERYEYTPYGERQVYTSSGTNDPKAYAPLLTSRRVETPEGGTLQPYGLNTIGHQGKMHDEVTRLIHYTYRYLHPRIGQWIQRDPTGYPDGMNAYAAYHVLHGGLDPTGLYEEDVHYYLTYYLASRIPCFSAEDARTIAEANQGTDESEHTAPGVGLTRDQRLKNKYYHHLGPEEEVNMYLNRLWRAATIGYLIRVREVRPGVHRFAGVDEVRNCDLQALGRFLHHYQDTFSHAGYTNSAWGHAPPKLESDDKLSEWGHWTDKTANNPRSASMASGTIHKMIEWVRACNCECYEEEIAGEGAAGLFSDGEWVDVVGRFLSAPGGPASRVINDEELRVKLDILGVPAR